MKGYRIFYFLFIIFLFLTSCKIIKNTSVEPFPECNNNIATLNLNFTDSVSCLDLSNKHLKRVPLEIAQFKNLKQLNLSKNNLDSIDWVVFSLENLEYLNVSKNNISVISSNIGNFKNLKRLDASQNHIEQIPSTIGNLVKLESIDLWGNEISELPIEITNLKETLKRLDLRVIMLNDVQKQQIINLLPNTKIFFSESCNCN